MDKFLWKIIEKEIKRQEETIDLIPSENFVDLETLFIVGSPLMIKYAEGFVGKRYYPGNKFIDKIESLAIKRALKAFRLGPEWGCNVQSYSGSPANLAVLLGLAEPGSKIMGLSLSSGGHLTHGHQVSYTGKLFKSFQYSVKDQLNYDEILKLAKKVKPKIIISGTTSYPRKIDFKKFFEIAKEVGAYHLADISHIAGLVIAKFHPSPFKWADVVTTTTHKTLRGPRGAVIFYRKELEEKIQKSVFPGLQGGPHLHTIAGIAYAFWRASKKDFKNYQKNVLKNSLSLCNFLKSFGFEFFTGGTDNHLMVIDLKNLGIDGKYAESLLEKSNILANRNVLPEDKKPFTPSGLRLGTPAITSRGLKEKEMRIIAEFIKEVILERKNVKEKVRDFIKNFPLPYKGWLKKIRSLI